MVPYQAFFWALWDGGGGGGGGGGGAVEYILGSLR
jgi:hypothetical protein